MLTDTHNQGLTLTGNVLPYKSITEPNRERKWLDDLDVAYGVVSFGDFSDHVDVSSAFADEFGFVSGVDLDFGDGVVAFSFEGDVGDLVWFAEVLDEGFGVVVVFDEFDCFFDEVAEFFEVFGFGADGDAELAFFDDENDEVAFDDAVADAGAGLFAGQVDELDGVVTEGYLGHCGLISWV